MSEESKALAIASALSVDGGLIAFACVLGDGARDRIVKASVQHPEVDEVVVETLTLVSPARCLVLDTCALVHNSYAGDVSRWVNGTQI